MSKITGFISGSFFVAILLFGVGTISAQAAGLTPVQVQAILGLLTSFGADSATIANVQTTLNGGTPTISGQFCYSFKSDLTVGSQGADVSALNQALSSSGIDTTGNTSNFTKTNAGDVVSFQAKYGIRQTGYVGPVTRAKLNALYGCTNNQQSTPPVTPMTTNTQSTLCNPQSPVAGCVIGNPAPTTTTPTQTCTITSSMPIVASGQAFTISWTANGIAQPVLNQNTAAQGLIAAGTSGLSSVNSSGTLSEVASTNNFSAGMAENFQIGTGGLSSGTFTPDCNVNVTVLPAPVTTTASSQSTTTASATIDQSSLTSTTGNTTITGTASGVSVVTLWANNGNGYVYVGGPEQVVNGHWSISLSKNMPAGTYAVTLQNNDSLPITFGMNQTLATGTLSVAASSTAVAPTATYLGVLGVQNKNLLIGGNATGVTNVFIATVPNPQPSDTSYASVMKLTKNGGPALGNNVTVTSGGGAWSVNVNNPVTGNYTVYVYDPSSQKLLVTGTFGIGTN